MRLFSTAGASFSFDETVPPAPPTILSSLQDPELRLWFERFAYFLYRRAYPADPANDPADSLSRAMFDLFVSHLLVFSGPDPSSVEEPYTDGVGNPIGKWRCNLLPPLAGNESLTALIVRRFEELQATSSQRAYDFQLYLYMTINAFFIWFCTELHTSQVSLPDAPRPFHQLLQPIRDYVANYVKYSWAGLKPHARDSWFSETWFLRACTMEYPADGAAPGFGTLPDLQQRFASFPWRRSKQRLAAIKVMAETIRRALVRFLESETKEIIGRLISQQPGLGNPLVDAYGEFRMVGLGNGTGTSALFRKPNYGLAFFNYLYKWGKKRDDLVVEVSFTRTETLPFCKKDNDGVSFFYFGLETPDPGQTTSPGVPSIRLSALDAEGKLLSGQRSLVTNGPDEHLFIGGPGGSNVTSEWFPSDSVNFLRAELKSDPPPPRNPEEVVFILFKHRMGERPPPAMNIEAEWTFNDNRFASADAIGGAPFSDQVLQDRLKLIISQIVNTPNVEIMSYIGGFGVGESLNHQAGEAGSDIRPSPTQADTHHSDPSYDALRYCYGHLFWTPSNATLVFYAEGYVSPLRCTWDAHLAETGGLSLFGTFGKYLPAGDHPQGYPRYNLLLSAFRAFSLCEGMMQAMITKTVEMALAGDITFAQGKALTDSLTAHLIGEAAAVIIQDGAPLERHDTEETIFVTHSIFHSFTVQ